VGDIKSERWARFSGLVGDIERNQHSLHTKHAVGGVANQGNVILFRLTFKDGSDENTPLTMR
jgi:hypothetical protein